MLKKPRRRSSTSAAQEEVSILELARLVVKTLGSKSRIERIPYDQAYAPGVDDMHHANPAWKNWASS